MNRYTSLWLKKSKIKCVKNFTLLHRTKRNNCVRWRIFLWVKCESLRLSFLWGSLTPEFTCVTWRTDCPDFSWEFYLNCSSGNGKGKERKRRRRWRRKKRKKEQNPPRSLKKKRHNISSIPISFLLVAAFVLSFAMCASWQMCWFVRNQE